MSETRWALHPGDEHCHAVAVGDFDRSGALGYAEALCGGAAAGLPDPGRVGTAF